MLSNKEKEQKTKVTWNDFSTQSLFSPEASRLKVDVKFPGAHRSDS
jgi:hypothetical protein